MISKEIKINEKFTILGTKYSDDDNANFLSVLNSWISYKESLNKIDGRNPNIPESLTEGLVSKHYSDTYRKTYYSNDKPSNILYKTELNVKSSVSNNILPYYETLFTFPSYITPNIFITNKLFKFFF